MGLDLDTGASVPCPDCGEEGTRCRTGVVQTRLRHEVEVWRQRVCKCDAAHKFWTIERPARATLEDVLVRAGSDGALLGPFSTVRLSRDIGAGALSRLGRDDVRYLVERVRESLDDRLPDLAEGLVEGPVKVKRRIYRLAILDSAIRDEVETQLRLMGNSPVRVLYALATRGRTDVDSREGFKRAEEFLEWCFSEPDFSRLKTRIPDRMDESGPELWELPKQVAVPKLVVKRDGTMMAFEHHRFRASIRRALYGRRSPGLSPDAVAAWVLSELDGQRNVMTAQLAAGVMGALRRLDEIAYLRWVGIAKQYGSVEDFVNEALDLIATPSRPLQLLALK